jgi:hypothetical protein
MEYDKIIFPAELMCWLGRQIRAKCLLRLDLT